MTDVSTAPKSHELRGSLLWRASPERLRSLRHACGIVGLIAAVSCGAWMTRSIPLVADERHHVAQVRLFLRGRWEMLPSLTTLPGYHLIVAALAGLYGSDSLEALRLCSLVISLVTLVALFALARVTGGSCAYERALQVAFLPLLFPLLFLVYTDVAGLLCLMLVLLLQQANHHRVAALAAAAMLLVRQNYVVWLGFSLVPVLTAGAISANGSGGRLTILLNPRCWLEHARGMRRPMSVAPYGIVMLLFTVFILWNGGVAVGDREMHPFPSFHLGNVYFALFTAWFLLLPLHIANARSIATLAWQPKSAGILAGFLLLFLSTFTVDHPYNQVSLDWWLHNRLLLWLASSPWTKLTMFVAVAITALSLAVTPVRERWQLSLYPFALVALVPSWQIEPRYYLPPLVLFLLFRVQRSIAFEWGFIAYLALLTVLLFAGIRAGSYFL